MPESNPLPGQKPGPTTALLPQTLDLTEAKPLRDKLASLSGRCSLVLDASAVERMSTPCAQVLLAVGRHAASAGSSFTILNPSPVFRSALADLGLEEEFREWMD